MIRAEDIDAVAAHAELFGPSDDLVRDLRRRWPAYHFTICLDEDIGIARPVRERRDFNIYLVSGANGCIGFTDDAAAASGMVIAERDEEGTAP
jgi:hypothetical protein